MFLESQVFGSDVAWIHELLLVVSHVKLFFPRTTSDRIVQKGTSVVEKSQFLNLLEAHFGLG